jgi:hypothetical protein
MDGDLPPDAGKKQHASIFVFCARAAGLDAERTLGGSRRATTPAAGEADAMPASSGLHAPVPCVELTALEAYVDHGAYAGRVEAENVADRGKAERARSVVAGNPLPRFGRELAGRRARAVVPIEESGHGLFQYRDHEPLLRLRTEVALRAPELRGQYDLASEKRRNSGFDVGPGC